MLSTPPWLAYVKISEGCDYTCTFCIIPSCAARTAAAAWRTSSAEARALAARGVRELVLVAQDSTRYGLDHGVRRRPRLPAAAARPGRRDPLDPRHVRLPRDPQRRVLDAIASEEKVVKYVDIPLQHASEPVLKRMKRPTGKGNLLGMVERIRERVPGVAIRTSFIVGFPGETDEDFEELLALRGGRAVRQRRRLHVLGRGGHDVLRAAGPRPEARKESRRLKLMSLQKKLSLRRNRARVGDRVEVLVEGTHADSDLLLRGRLASQAPEIDGQVIVNDGTAEPALRDLRGHRSAPLRLRGADRPSRPAHRRSGHSDPATLRFARRLRPESADETAGLRRSVGVGAGR